MSTVASLMNQSASAPLAAPLSSTSRFSSTRNASTLNGIFDSAPRESQFQRGEISLRTKRPMIQTNQKRFETHHIFGGENTPTPGGGNVNIQIPAESQQKILSARQTKSNIFHSTAPSSAFSSTSSSSSESIVSSKGRVPNKGTNESNVDLALGSKISEVKKTSIGASTKNISTFSLGNHSDSVNVNVNLNVHDNEQKTARGSVKSDKNVSKVFVDSLSPNAKMTRKAMVIPSLTATANSQKRDNDGDVNMRPSSAATARKNSSSVFPSNSSSVHSHQMVTEEFPLTSRNVKSYKNSRNESHLWLDKENKEGNAKRHKGGLKDKNEGNGAILSWK